MATMTIRPPDALGEPDTDHSRIYLVTAGNCDLRHSNGARQGVRLCSLVRQFDWPGSDGLIRYGRASDDQLE